MATVAIESAPRAARGEPERLPTVLSAAPALPSHYRDQEALIDAAKQYWVHNPSLRRRLEQLFRSTGVEGRHLALSIDEMAALRSFEDANGAYIRCAVDLGARAVSDALARAGRAPRDVDHVFFASVTGIATPSIDARIANRLGLRRDVKRTPIFGLGCVAGAAGLARASDYLRAYPDEVALLLTVELCSLTLQRDDDSIRNLIAGGLFGDGAAAVVLGGSVSAGAGPQVLATRSVLFPDTEQMMGWDVTDRGFRVVLSADVPSLVRDHLRGEVDDFLAGCDLELAEIESFVCHPGGPKVLRALAEALELPDEALAITWKSLARVGNVSSASVLFVLDETMRRRPRPGSLGLLIGMGPGFCAELVLLAW
ncbi:MAG TPA: 3-oxoacyl-[acyl-carrier-protein] synthase III C-terminal domain-containing protein [Myxococcota bacterium]|nr:3-oxoacyl-[acyl-carrier-protein] synthase III C-terminal domain-containing protein [Myxococcota bacterium]